MSLGERVKKVRKARDLTQQQFAERLGMKRNSIAQVEGGRSTSDQTVFAICREFNVNEHWLRTGEGEMFIKPDTFSLDEYAKERGATDLDLAIAKVYFDLPPTVRADMLADLKRLLVGTEQTAEQEPAEAPPQAAAPRIAAVPARPAPASQRAKTPDEMTLDEMKAELERQFYREKKAAGKSLDSGQDSSGKAVG